MHEDFNFDKSNTCSSLAKVKNIEQKHSLTFIFLVVCELTNHQLILCDYDDIWIKIGNNHLNPMSCFSLLPSLPSSL